MAQYVLQFAESTPAVTYSTPNTPNGYCNRYTPATACLRSVRTEKCTRWAVWPTALCRYMTYRIPSIYHCFCLHYTMVLLPYLVIPSMTYRRNAIFPQLTTVLLQYYPRSYRTPGPRGSIGQGLAAGHLRAHDEQRSHRGKYCIPFLS